jgi:hypothetical protein
MDSNTCGFAGVGNAPLIHAQRVYFSIQPSGNKQGTTLLSRAHTQRAQKLINGNAKHVYRISKNPYEYV